MVELSRYSAQNTCETLNRRIVDYIKSEYFGKHDELRKVCSSDLESNGTLFNEPYFEASPAYTVKNHGLQSATIPPDTKQFLSEMAKNRLGVYENPYVHQIDALENYFSKKDMLVATGTGSGKTECFMWPIAAKLFDEAKNKSQSWAQRGVRVLMLYPMNALVSDQLARMRNMLGTDKFRTLFRNQSGHSRIPTFGMYTSRTKYTGKRSPAENKKVAGILRSEILNKDFNLQDKLLKMGRCPAKADLDQYVNYLETDDPSYNTDDDSELFLRWEMQDNPPDILITNYSMLEYLLFRPHEKQIWDNTKTWLNQSPENKLLFIIDEAHMYRGAAGGEVSLLVRRVLNRLQIPRTRVQFILTTASVPSNRDNEVLMFARNLTSGNIDTPFRIISGQFDSPQLPTIFVQPENIIGFDLDLLEDESKVFSAAEDLLCRMGFSQTELTFDHKLDSMGAWLYENLKRTDVISNLLKECRGHATKYGDLAKLIFPKAEQNIAQQAVDSILALTPFAKNTDGRMLVPTKLHLIYRGLNGAYACINPNCPDRSIVGLGKIYLNKKSERCGCGGRIFELMNHRNCGALYIRGYMEKTPSCDDFIWPGAGKSYDSDLREVHFYVLSGSTTKNLSGKVIWADSKTGKIRTDDSCTEKDGYIRLMYVTEEKAGKPNLLTFNRCPKCNMNGTVTDFATKGNDPFFNIVSQQLSIQPPSLFASSEVKETPNEGRKVLLFSDSRKNAAKLAQDLSELSVSEALRASIVLSARTLNNWAKIQEIDEVSLDYLYAALLKIIYDNSLNLFFDNDEKQVAEDISNVEDRLKVEADKVRYDKIKKRVQSLPNLLKIRLLKEICSDRRSLMDLSLGWVEPTDEFVFEDINKSGFSGDKLRELKNLIITWINFTLKDSYSISYFDINLELNVPHYGIKDDSDLLIRYRSFLSAHGWSEEELNIVHNLLLKLLVRKDSLRYINADMVKLNCSEADWYRCPECNSVSPVMLYEQCSNCF